jgi:Uma2 family endonuclease
MTLSTVALSQLSHASRFLSISVDQYQTMMEAGIIEEGAPIELLDGMLVLKDRSHTGDDIMTVGREHMWSVRAVGNTNDDLKPRGYLMQIQMPVVVSRFGEPEPDGAILAGSNDDYLHRKPTAADVTCVIEVADSSLQFDRTTKLRAYARAGIRQYLIVNLVNGAIEEHTDPIPDAGQYANTKTLRPGESLDLFLRGEERLTIRVEQWVPVMG